ncbi:hypothetical protein SERLA73DRAFT_179637 [Serpula lacrymans var. lacrymans S7.3]|uniref:N-acetyltransferase domain-containing protein n=2 Tax=Serpula lacrymans var. lacrymans TaxID=341189 RepID=F8PVV9_SERL3|nr:uncharacterized protein SERLADRAFT_464835 [Serpula lacrymans var. lacrymans S7.9]EGN99555.1 hypothetical protein SERLA73DRAFT_179637 [Serpula lacrymans var. lacrymans S7.3]EGO25126.1 hypothetical protein SERLADRAFT_464835 [Serpula lacrymans var. lacrymans S7.9]
MQLDSDAVPYDVNFCFPVHDLENDRVRLTPFVPSLYAESFVAASLPYPELFKYVPFGPFASAKELVNDFIEPRIHHNPTFILFAVISKASSPGDNDGKDELAGIIGLLNTSTKYLQFQRTHVTSNAVGLLMFYALDLPSESGLGLRRLQWQANELNAASIRVAEKMGFKKEAVIRWDRAVPRGRGKVSNGQEIREGDPLTGMLGRNTVVLAICWDDWLTEREKVNDRVQR